MRVPFERQQHECVMAKTELSSALLYMCSVPADIVWHQKCTCLPSYVTSRFHCRWHSSETDENHILAPWKRQTCTWYVAEGLYVGSRYSLLQTECPSWP